MDITWYGHSCFRITERGRASIVTDPYHANLGYGELNVKADVVTISHNKPGHATLDGVRNFRFVIERPGEFEIGGVFIIGAAMVNRKEENPRYNVVYTMDFSSVNLVHLGDLNYVPSQSEMDALGQVDVALVPVGGGEALNAAQAAEVVSLLEPSIVVPMHYQTPHCVLDLAPMDKFLTEMGVTNPIETDSLRVTSSSLPEQPQVVILSYKSQEVGSPDV